ncbi:MAG: hypothetical protein CMH52_01260 [Myxococcales bacterium]|nr:hypothetical protein [Myxococcales bacterium]|tara:strand:+ start:1625 stop:2197 length:573 start_codon:yes stop_codon:yes gene_type:complete
MNLIRPIIVLLSVWICIGCEPDDDFLAGTDATFELDISFNDAGTESGQDDSGTVMMSGCMNDEDCGDPSLICLTSDDGLGGVCAECLDNTYCPMERPYCGIDSLCSAESQDICRDPLDCQNPNRAQCLVLGDSQIGSCVECRDDDECVQPRPFCGSTGMCVASQNEIACDEAMDECGLLRTCIDGACVER